VGALLEPPVDGGTVGPTGQCIIADVFYRLRFSDRFFFDVRGKPGSFSPGMYNIWYYVWFIFIFKFMNVNDISIHNIRSIESFGKNGPRSCIMCHN